MATFRPSLPFTTRLTVFKPIQYEYVAGVRKGVLPDEGFEINASFRTFGGTETTENGVYSIIDTAEVETWYRPDITADCIVEVNETGERYRVIGTPENIARRNQFLKFKIQRLKGGA